MGNLIFSEPDFFISKDLHLGKVLVVEDELLWQMLISRTLKKINKNVEVSFSKSATHALNEIIESEDNQFDLIISDQSLEDLETGLDLWSSLVEKKYNIPYVLLSGTPRADFQKNIGPLGMNGIPHYIEKSASVSQLLNQLNFFITFNGPVVTRVSKDTKTTNGVNYWAMAMIGLLILMYCPHLTSDEAAFSGQGSRSIASGEK